MGRVIDSLDLRSVSKIRSLSPARNDFSQYGEFVQQGSSWGRMPSSSPNLRIQNAFIGSNSGAMGPGDRTANKWLPWYSDNPFLTNDFVYKWRQWTMLYETDWASRKIINIPVDDALRKPWIAEGINSSQNPESSGSNAIHSSFKKVLEA